MYGYFSKLKVLAILACVMLLIAGCSSSHDMTLAQAQIATFHKQLDAGNFHQIYQFSSQALKDATSETDFIELLSTVNQRLGKYQKSSQVRWGVNYDGKGDFISIAVKTEYANGSALEHFLFRVESGKAKLAAYRIDSKVLIHPPKQTQI